MSYSADELFSFWETNGECSLTEYKKRYDQSVTELEIPAEHNGLPVDSISQFCFQWAKYIKRIKIPPSVRFIWDNAFIRCESLENVEFSEGLEQISEFAFHLTGLKSAVLPKSLQSLGNEVFSDCKELESVIFNSAPKFGKNVFDRCPKLPPETLAMGLIRSTDLTRHFLKKDIREITKTIPYERCDLFRRDVFEILAKNDCFGKCDMSPLFEKMICEGKTELFPLAEQYGVLDRERLVDGLIEYSVEQKRIEITAYLLDLKNRKFGFDPKSKLKL